MLRNRFAFAARGASIHLGACLFVAAIAATLVYGIWFPYPYASLESGQQLFILLIFIDVICGPLLTLIVFDPKKKKSELTRDLFCILLIQVSSLAYGINSIYLSRPVFLAFEVDRFRVVSAMEVPRDDLPKAIVSFQRLSKDGPRLIAVKVPQPGDPDYLHSIELTLMGLETAIRPELWRFYEEQRQLVQSRMLPIALLKRKNTSSVATIDSAIEKFKVPEASVGYLPVVGHSNSDWVAIVAREDARVLGFAPVNGF